MNVRKRGISMGNRATIKLKNDPKARGVYTQWQGGEGSVTAFVEETQRRITGAIDSQKEADAALFYAVLFGVIRDFAAYCTAFKNRRADMVLMAIGEDELKDSDNGTYLIEDDFSCERFNHSIFDDKERADYTHITVFFNEFHHAACAVFDDEIPRFSNNNNETIQGLKADMAAAEVTAKKAQSRIDRLKARIEQLEKSQVAAELEARLVCQS